ncbi:hypothetical protein SDC9_08035 [bioreactor metagenome]|uniref:Uncharacterized protein n=1 Tax=bioreactor metagenome TaxID=1076179 RepID=A0A644T661_9ZZZZ|nr:TraM recognition domain-containing protein [Candidatus Elulimicrobiales bacterium]
MPNNLENSPNYSDLKFSSPEEELKFLREEVGRRQEISKNFEGRITKEDNAKDVVREYIQNTPQSVLPHGYELRATEQKKLLEILKPKDTDGKVSELISIMLDKGLHTSINLVRDLKDKEVSDDFHRFLVNFLTTPYDEKITRGLDKAHWKALNMKLYELILPEKSREDGKSVKEFIVFMEQFYAAMLAITSDTKNKENDYYSLEIAKPNDSNEIIFFVSVSKERADLFEKTIFALFPDIIVRHSVEDYNIFSHAGFPVAAYATSLKTPALPIRTYEKIEGDPISLIMSAFTKLQKNGEAASMQILVRPAGEEFIKKYTSILEEIRKGETLKRIVARDSFVKDFMLTLKEMKKSEEELKKDKEKPKKMEDEKALEHIAYKLSSTIVDTNIRILANADTLPRAKSILHEVASTFIQYTEVDGNSLQFKMLEGNRLNEEINNFIYRLWTSSESLPLNLKELATLYHIPGYVKNFSQLKKTDAATAAAPMDLPQEGLFLGFNEYRHLKTKIFIPEKDRLRHVYVIGQTGTGKSVMLKNMILQDIIEGRGCCFIDPHGEDIQDILGNIPQERWKDVIYFDPADTSMPMGLNMLEFDPSKPEQKTFVINELFSIFKKLFAESSPESMGPAFEQYFRNSAGLVMEHPESGCTLLDISRVLSDEDYRNYKLAHSKNPLINQFFKNALATTGESGFENYVPYITNKFDVFVANEIMRPIIAQEKSSFDIANIMDTQKIFLVNLSKGRLGDMNANLIGLILVGKFLMAALGRENPESKPPFYLYLDEFQNISTPSISAILSEARKYKLSLNVAHQYIGQLSDSIKAAIFGNVGSKIIFRVSEEDAKYLEASLAPTFSAADIMKIENHNAYVSLLINGYPQKPFNIVEKYFLNYNSYFSPRGDKEVIETLKRISKETYGRPRAKVEEEIMKKFNFT